MKNFFLEIVLEGECVPQRTWLLEYPGGLVVKDWQCHCCLRRASRLWHRLDPMSGNFCTPQVQPPPPTEGMDLKDLEMDFQSAAHTRPDFPFYYLPEKFIPPSPALLIAFN